MFSDGKRLFANGEPIRKTGLPFISACHGPIQPEICRLKWLCFRRIFALDYRQIASNRANTAYFPNPCTYISWFCTKFTRMLVWQEGVFRRRTGGEGVHLPLGLRHDGIGGEINGIAETRSLIAQDRE